MKKSVFVFTFILCNIFCAFSQTPSATVYSFDYGPFPPDSCYIIHSQWKISHGSPVYDTRSANPHHYYLRLDANSSPFKSEGLFTNFAFSKCKRYKFEIVLKDLAEIPQIHLYAANGLSENIDRSCSIATLPIVSDKEHISGGAANCSGIYPIVQRCTITIPLNANSYWTPAKNYNQFWIHSASGSGAAAFIIEKIIVYDYGNVPSTPPTMPGNLRATAVSGTAISVAWIPSSDEIKVDGYQVYLNGSLKATTEAHITSYTFSNLSECSNYTIEVRAVNALCNYSQKASVSTKTTTK